MLHIISTEYILTHKSHHKQVIPPDFNPSVCKKLFLHPWRLAYKYSSAKGLTK